MSIAPYRIQRIVLDTARIQVKRLPVDCFDEISNSSASGGRPSRSSYRAVKANVSGYAVTSSAPCNTDEKTEPNAAIAYSFAQAEQGVGAIAHDLHRIIKDPTISEPPQLIVAVHGYNTAESSIREWYHDIFRYIAQDDQQISQKRNLVFVGYRWSSERIFV